MKFFFINFFHTLFFKIFNGYVTFFFIFAQNIPIDFLDEVDKRDA